MSSTPIDVPGDQEHQQLWPASWREASVVRSVALSSSAEGLGERLSRVGSSFLGRPHVFTTTDEELTAPLISSTKDAHAVAAENSCGFWETLFNAANILAGVGLLTTPYALATGGWATLPLLLFIGGAACYTGRLLGLCMSKDPRIKTYPDIAGAAFGDKGRIVLAVLLYFELFCCCVEYIILAGDNLAAVFPNATLAIGGQVITANQAMIFLTFLIVLPTTWLRDMSLMSIISVGGIFVAIALFLLTFVEGIAYTGFSAGGSVSLLEISKLPMVIGVYSFCFSGHAVFPSIYSSMKDKGQFTTLLTVSFGLVVSMYAIMAAIGALMFGSGLDDNITLNMNDEYPTAIPTYMAVWLTILTPFTKFALTLAPCSMALEELLPMKEGSLSFTMSSLGIRTGLMVLVLLVALVVPFFGFVMSFIGAFLSMSLSIILPCTFYLSLARGTVPKWEVGLCVGIAIFGVVAGSLATYDALANIIGQYS